MNKRNTQILLLLLVSVSAIICAAPDGKLLQVVETFRHGARRRIYTDNFKYGTDAKAALDYGELTGEGQRMHYVLGQNLREIYSQTPIGFPITYDHTFIHAKSTNVNRTIMSAYSQLAGMFPLNNGIDLTNVDKQFLVPPFAGQKDVAENKFALGGGQQPIPIHVRDANEEKQLLGYMDACANAAQWSKANKDDADWNRIKGEFQNVFDALAKKNDYFQLIPNPDLDDVSHLVDTLIAQKWAGDDDKNKEIAANLEGFDLTLEEMLDPKNFNTLWVQMNLLYSIQLHLALFKTEQQKRTTVTPFLNELVAYFNNFQADPEHYFKWIMLSAHDTTIAMVSQGLNFTSWECMEQVKLQKQPANSPCIYTYPGFASNIIFELYEDADKKAFIKAKYNGTEQFLCDGTKTYCYLDDFSQRVANFVVPDFDTECGNPIYVSTPDSDDSTTPTWAIVVISIVSVLLAGALVFIFLQRRKINSLTSVDKASNYSNI